jgi:hypothetical protein
MLEASQISKNEHYAAFNKKTMDMTLTAAREFAIKEILPTMVLGDKEGVTLKRQG